MGNCIRELKARVKLHEDEISLTDARIEVEQNKIDNLNTHKANLHFFISRLCYIIEEIEFEHKTEEGK